MKRILIFLFVLALLGASFGWGFIAHRSQVFPYTLLRGFGVEIGSGHRTNVKAPPGNIQALPYVEGTFDPNSDLIGVIRNDRARASKGLNYFSSRKRDTSYLVDMDGQVVHEWHYDTGPWMHSQLLPNGDVLAVVNDIRLLRLDKDGNHLWSVRDRFHHGTWVAENGDIYAIAREGRVVPEIHETVETLVDRIVVLDGDGEVKEDFAVVDVLLRSPYAYLLPSVNDRQFKSRGELAPELDIFHLNHVQVLDGSQTGRSPLFAKGNLLICLRNINAIAILDAKSRDVLWLWGPTNLAYQHHATLLDNGNILLFNNGLKRSEIIEVEPLTRKVVWRYAPRKGFFSLTMGSVQRLPNGNTLITDSSRGYVREVTPDGEIVWEFANPDIDGEGMRGSIWRMTRFTPEELPFLDAE